MPCEVGQWFNNKRSVTSSQYIPTRPAGMIKVDAGNISAIHQLKSNLQFTVNCKHVYRHQNGKNKKKQEKQDKELEEENEEFDYEMEAERTLKHRQRR